MTLQSLFSSPAHDVAPLQQTGISGVPEGALVLTLDGAIPVEFLNPGDKVLTRSAGAVTLKAVHKVQQVLHAVRVEARALGLRAPMGAVVLPSAQQVLVRGYRADELFGQPQAFATVGALVDDARVRDLGAVAMSLYQLDLGRARIIYAAGLELICGEIAQDAAVATR